MKEQDREDGIQLRLCTLALDDNTFVIYGGEAIYTKDKFVGRVCSRGYRYTAGKILPSLTCRTNWQLRGLRLK